MRSLSVNLRPKGPLSPDLVDVASTVARAAGTVRRTSTRRTPLLSMMRTLTVKV